jgi:dethiobiotin synthetase
VLPDQAGDLIVVQTLGGTHILLKPVRLPDPLAPDTAARRAGITSPVADTAARIIQLTDTHDLVLVEGDGGLLVRLDGDGATGHLPLEDFRAAASGWLVNEHTSATPTNQPP